MALQLPDDRLKASDSKQVGWVGESEVDRAIGVGSGWRLLPYVPLYDTRHVDRVYAWDGIDRPQFVQIKTALGPNADGFYRWRIQADSFKAYRNFSVALCGADPDSLRMEWVWAVDSRLIRRLGSLTRIPKTGKSEYNLWASTRTEDRMARYRRRPPDLWRVFAPALPLPLRPAPFPRIHVEEGAYFEYAFVAECLAGGGDQLQCYRPAVDVAGRDMLVQLANSWRAAYVQVKGTASLEPGHTVHCWVPRNTFEARDDFWLAFYYYDRARPGLFEDCWLVSSGDFVRMTADQRSATEMIFRAKLDPERDRWRAFRHPVKEQGRVLRRALSDLTW